MHIREYQEWLQAWDKARTWDRVLASHTFLHAVEEMGEISRLLQEIEGYRPDSDPHTLRAELSLELSDLQVMIFKIAYLCGIDMEEAMQRGMQKADSRFPDPEDGPEERDAYWRRFRKYVAEHRLDDE